MIYLLENNFPLNAAFDDEIIQEANSTYQLTFKFPTTDSKWTELKNEVLLVADDLHGEQYFSIFEVEKQHGYITVYANQVATLLNSYSINTISVDRGNGFTVMNALVSAFKRPSPFTFFSDINSKHTINLKNVSVMEALVKDKHSIVGQWGGDLVRDKYSIRLLERAGVENESLFAYKKNMKPYQESSSTKELKTRIHFRRVIESHDEHKKDQVFTATIDSPLIGKYKNIYEADMEVQDQDVVDQKTLEEYGKRYFRETLCDMVEESLEIDVIGQADQPVNLFDTVSVLHEQYNVDLRKKITKYRFAPMRKKLVSIGFGKVSQSFGSALGSLVENKVNEQLNEKLSGRDKEYEKKVQKLVDNANAEYSKKATALEQEITDGIEQAKAQAEAVKKLISNDIERRFQEFGSKDLEEVRRKAEEALKKAGTMPDMTTLSDEIKRQVLNSPDLAHKVTETFANDNNGNVIYGKILQNIQTEFTPRATFNGFVGSTNSDLSNLQDKTSKAEQAIKRQTIEFNKLTESNRLYERIIGTSETDAPDKLSRLVMSSDIFQTEVGKYVTDDNNLIVNSETMDKNTLVNPRQGIDISVNDGVLTIKAQGLTSYNWSGFTLPIYVRKIYKGETYSLGFKYRIRGKLDHDFNVIIKNHISNRAAFIATAGTSNSPVSDDWKEFQGTFYMSSDFEFGNHRNFPFYAYITKNGWVEIKEIILVRGSNTGPYKPSQFDDAYKSVEATRTQVTQLAGSYAIRNLNSAGDIINGINLGADGTTRFVSKLTHISGDTLIDNAVIKSAMVDKLKTGNFESGSVTTQILASNAVTADKLLVDSAMINKLVTNQAFIRELTSQKAFITQLNSIAVTAEKIQGGRLTSNTGSMVFDLDNSSLNMMKNTASIRRIYNGYPTQFMRYEASIENGHKHAKTIIGSNRNGTENWNSPSFAGIVIDNNANNSLDNIYQFGDHIHFKHSQGDDGWRFSNVSQIITPGVWNKNSEIWARSFVIPRETRGANDTPTKFINLVESIAALWKLWAHAKGQIGMTDAMKNVIQGSLDAWGYSRPHI
jgi:phage minor structural protein, N-terminal domain protein|uniref:Neck appendage protein n=1 Tax=Siphoviridae sp. cteIs11 TaxID=2826403 RepID=A0A8S5NRX3_9CAUD|nr:MAG TPA: Neck appendage protein [Siphoviridae sp. cteIs11]